MTSGVFIKENIAFSFFKKIFFQTRSNHKAIHMGKCKLFLLFSSSSFFGPNEKRYQILILEFTVSFAPLRPAGFVNSCGAGRGGAGQGLLFAGRGGAGQPVFPRGGVGKYSTAMCYTQPQH